MKRLALLLALAAGPALADCPPRDLEAEIAPLMTAVHEAGNEMEARTIMNELWQLWATAPDARAQEFLDDGMRMRAESNLDGAWEAFNRLIAYCPNYAEGYNQRAFVAFIRGDYPSALDDLEKALALDPDHLGALTGKALTEIGIAGPEAGQETLRKALEMNPWLPERRFLLEPEGQEL